jgi:uncharacterized protein (TIGR03083 family)
MDSASYLDHLRRELGAFEACLDGDLSASVEHCGDWTLYDLADHLGHGNLWAAAGVTEQRGDHEAPAAPRDGKALTSWFGNTAEVLLAALDTDPSAPAWTIAPPPTVGFWQRRRCMETLVHRWDAEHALGSAGPLDPVVAADGIAEVIDTMTPRQIRLGRIDPLPHAIRLTAADVPSSWLLGPGEPVATARATAAELFLMLWGRLAADDQAITWEGDRDKAMAMLGGSLVPLSMAIVAENPHYRADRACMSAKPSRLSPRHRPGSAARSSPAAKPMPQTRSRGLASTST